MNPVIVIPTYWDDHTQQTRLGEIGTYDHPTAVDTTSPELETCLASLDEVRGVMRVIILLVAPHAIEDTVRKRVEALASRHEDLNICIIGSYEARLVREAIGDIVPEMQGETISLRGYGAIKNMGLAVSAILGHDCVVFLDDDEIVLDQNFLIDAVYGLGRKNRQGLPLLVKSGYYERADGSPFADDSHIPWYDKKWSKKQAFNAWLDRALSSTRISRSNVLCGGCMAIHAEAFTKVAFDPFITRGEDLDYLINLRLYGKDVWFDNKWHVRHMPPPTPSHASRFAADVFRWLYEAQKVLTANVYAKLRPVTVASLSPYPGKWISNQVIRPIIWTCRARMIGTSQHAAYLKILTTYIPKAQAYAQNMSFEYFAFMSFWPTIISFLWKNDALKDAILRYAQVQIKPANQSDDSYRIEDGYVVVSESEDTAESSNAVGETEAKENNDTGEAEVNDDANTFGESEESETAVKVEGDSTVSKAEIKSETETQATVSSNNG